MPLPSKPVKPVLPLFTGQAIQVSTEAGQWLHSPASPFRIVREYESTQ